MFTVQRYCTKNDANGNPRRVYVIRDVSGDIVATVDEQYGGGGGVTDFFLPKKSGQTYSQECWRQLRYVTDLGDVDVRPGVYYRMLKS